jgi:retron-type reverse transcriptase
MSFFDWLRSLFGAKRKRDASRLQPAPGASADAGDEIVDLSGGPLKEGHLRLALRDRRLLPKVKPPTRALGLTKRKRVMTSEEAGRLFGGTMRTRNRNLRDLLTDEAQLERYGLPLWRSEQDVADALGILLKELWWFSIHREREEQPHYITFAIPKRSGGRRIIMAPKRRLKEIQRRLLDLLVDKLPVSDCAHGFRRGRSIRTGAEPHVGKRFVLKLDLKDFFPTVTFARVRGMLVAYGYSFPVAATLAVLMTEAERQPVAVEDKVYHVPVGARYCVQGAPTSPGLCNAILLRMDRRLEGLARKRGLSYTRYADDLVFSGDLEREAFERVRRTVVCIIGEEGFAAHPGKTRCMGRGGRQLVTGVVVNETLGLPRGERRRLRAALHRQRIVGGSGDAGESRRLRGKIAYLSMLNPDQATKLAE